jgi:hypothetical protein
MIFKYEIYIYNKKIGSNTNKIKKDGQGKRKSTKQYCQRKA